MKFNASGNVKLDFFISNYREHWNAVYLETSKFALFEGFIN